MQILENADALARRAAEMFVDQAGEAVKKKRLFTVALSGGSTPKHLYALLGSEKESFRRRIPWDKIHFFWGDERHVPPDHSDSNYRMAQEVLLSKAPVSPEHVHRIKAENPDAGKAANAYEEELRDFFQLGTGQWPRFDLVLLGMGSDGHTASLFAGTEVIAERNRCVAASWVDRFNTFRITLTPPVLNNSVCVMFLVSGGGKSEILKRVLRDEYQPERLPVQVIRPTNGKLFWLVDRAAAHLLEDTE